MISKRGTRIYGGPQRSTRGSDAIKKYRASKGVGGSGMTEPVRVHRSSKYPPAGRAASFTGARVMNPADGTAYKGGDSHSPRHYGQRRGYPWLR